MSTEVASIYAKVGADLSGFHSGMAQFNSSINGAGGMFRNFTTGIIQGIGQAFGQAAIRTIREFGDVVGSVIGSAADMEQSVADIAANMQLTGEETKKTADLISDLGIDPKLKVTATEAASAIEMLGKNGLSLQDILDGAARSTILLSNSTGADFSASADIATSAMASFGIQAKDMAGAINQIVGVTQNSKLDMNDYRLAISQAGGVAGAVGVEFDDFNAVLTGTAHLFGSGSDQGTAFKTFLQRLVPQSAEAADAMRDIGLYTGLTGKEFDKVQDKLIKVQAKMEDLDPTSKNYSERMAELSEEMSVLTSQLVGGSSAFFDANGNMKSAAEISESLRVAFSNLSEEQKISAATTIFGTDAMRMAFGVADLGTEAINRYKEAVGKTDAEESAAVRMNTLKGAWEIFTGIVESLSIKLGTAMLPALRQVVDSLIDLSGRVGPQLEAWGAQFGERLKMISDAAVQLLNIGLAEGFAGIFGQFEDGSRNLDLLWEAMGMTQTEAMKMSQRLIDTVTVIVDMAQAIGSLIITIGNIVGPVASWIEKTIGLENALRAVGLLMAGSFVASIAGTISTIVGAVSSVATFVGGLTGLSATATTVGAAVSAAIAAMGGPITIVLAAIGALALAWSQNWWDIQGKTKAAWEAIKGFVSDGVEAIKRFFNGGWWELGQNMVRGLVDGIKAGWQWVWDAAQSVATAALDAAQRTLDSHSPSREFEKIGQSISQGLAGGINSTQGLVNDSMVTVGQSLIQAWNSQTDEWRIKAIDKIKPVLASLGNEFGMFEDATIVALKNTASMSVDQLSSIINQMSDSVRIGFVENLPKSVKTAITSTRQVFEDGTIGIQKNVDSLASTINQMSHDVRIAFVDNLPEAAKQAIKATHQVFEDGTVGIQKNVNEMIGSINQMATEVRVAFVDNLPKSVRDGLRAAGLSIFEDGTIGNFGDGNNGPLAGLGNQLKTSADGIAQDTMYGLVTGINSRMRWLQDVGGDLARAVLDPIKRALGIASPSKVFRELGENVTQGFALGIGDNLDLPTVQINKMVSHSVQTVPANMAGNVTSNNRLDIYVHGDSNLPTDRAKLRELARALQSEFVMSGARVAVA